MNHEAQPDSQSIRRAAGLLRAGGVVAFPTETVYGLGAVALNPAAVARIFEIKNRPSFDPLIVHVAHEQQVVLIARSQPEVAHRLMKRFWPGPLTLVLPRNPAVPDLVTSGLPTVAVRMPRHPLALRLIEETGLPLAAPSANPFGCTSPTTAEHVSSQLGPQVDMILDGGPCSVGIESTILSLVGEIPLVLRLGGLAIEEIEAEIGPVRVAPPTDDLPQAPGRLSRHYAPRTPLILLSSIPGQPKRQGPAGLLAFGPPPPEHRYAAVEQLSESRDPREAAANLFAALRRLDALKLDAIFAAPLPESGLGRAINDRLRRASIRGETPPEQENPA